MDAEPKNTEEEPEPEKTPAQIILDLALTDGVFESPIDLNVAKMTDMRLADLTWVNYELLPKKMKATNTGHTLIISGKWHIERPYLYSGPIIGKYVFSQLHFHWGKTCMEGSEHTVDGMRMPLEMHVVHFKSSYLTQESALREKDGLLLLVYFFKLQSVENRSMTSIVSAIDSCREPHTSSKLDPAPLAQLAKPFGNDFFAYWGSVMTNTCGHIVLWIICRDPIGISQEQVEEFRKLLDVNNDPLVQNFREIRPVENRTIFHLNPSGFKHATLKSIQPEE